MGNLIITFLIKARNCPRFFASLSRPSLVQTSLVPLLPSPTYIWYVLELKAAYRQLILLLVQAGKSRRRATENYTKEQFSMGRIDVLLGCSSRVAVLPSCIPSFLPATVTQHYIPPTTSANLFAQNICNNIHPQFRGVFECKWRYNSAKGSFGPSSSSCSSGLMHDTLIPSLACAFLSYILLRL